MNNPLMVCMFKCGAHLRKDPKDFVAAQSPLQENLTKVVTFHLLHHQVVEVGRPPKVKNLDDVLVP